MEHMKMLGVLVIGLLLGMVGYHYYCTYMCDDKVVVQNMRTQLQSKHQQS